MAKLLRHVTYQFPTYFVTLERATEQERIDEIESAGGYIDKADTTVGQRAVIDSEDPHIEIVGGELIVGRMSTPEGETE